MVRRRELYGVEAKDLSSPNPNAPTFKEYANRLIPAGTALAIWLQISPHPTMSELVVPLDDREDLIANIVSLKAVARRCRRAPARALSFRRSGGFGGSHQHSGRAGVDHPLAVIALDRWR